MSHPFDETARLIGELLAADDVAARAGLAGYTEDQRRRLRAEAAELRHLARVDRAEARAGLLVPEPERRPEPPCPCECSRGEFCGGCGHRGCGMRSRPSESELRALWGDR